MTGPEGTNPWLGRTGFAWAHQGGAGEAPSNTIHAMERALAAGADGIELDVHLTADGALVVLHDARVDRTTDGHGKVAAMTRAEVQTLDAAAGWPGLAGRAPADHDLRIPTLDEVLQRIPGPLTVEVKTAAAARPTVEALRRDGRLDEVILTSFHDPIVQRLRRAAPDAALAPGRLWNLWFLFRCLVRRPPRRSRFVAAQLPYRYRGVPVLRRRVVDAAHRAGLAVHAWTIDDPGEMRKLLDMGVDGIMTDRPSVLEEVLRRRR